MKDIVESPGPSKVQIASDYRTSSSAGPSVVLRFVGGEARRTRCSSRFLGVGCI